MAEVKISVRRLHGSPSFEFLGDGGVAVRVSNVIVFDHRRTKEVWEISALSWPAVRARAKSQLEERFGHEHLTLPDGMDSLADFLPADPRHRIAKEVRDWGYRSASIELRSLTYAVVPPGFEQTIPEGGPPAALQAGHTYRVVLLGSDFGSLIFEAAA